MLNWKDYVRDASIRAGHILDDDITEELALHAHSSYEAARADGYSREDAEARVLAIIDSWLKDVSHLRRRPQRPSAIEPPAKTSSTFAGLMNDVRYGVRTLIRQRGFALLAILTMAIGLGVTTTLISVAYSVLLKPLPWPEPERLVRLTETREGATRRVQWVMTNTSYLPWRDQPSTIEALGAWTARIATITTGEAVVRVPASRVSSSVFSMLGMRPMLGTIFTAKDEAVAQVDKVILSYGIWQEQFGGDASALGKSLSIDGRTHQIIGIMPPDIVFPNRDARLWTPLYVPPHSSLGGQPQSLLTFGAMARLRSGMTPEQAAAEATARARNAPDAGLAALAIFGSNGPVQVSAVPALDALTGDVRPALISMVLGVGLLLMTATANVMGLQIARASTRRREIAIRSAIGAGTDRIIQQLLIESVLLGLGGGVSGLLMAAGLHRVLPWMLPADFPRVADISLDWQVLGFVSALTLLVGVVLGILPALHFRRLSLTEALTDNGTASTASRHSGMPRARMAIMAGQIAIACTLLVGASLLGKSFFNMMTADRGFDADNLLTARLIMPDFAFSGQRRLEVFAPLLDHVRLLPGVRKYGFTTGLPLISSENLSGFSMRSLRPPVGTRIEVHSVRSVVTDDYFATMGMRVVRGRGFSAADTAVSTKVVVVNRTFARQYLSEAALGDKIQNFAQGDGVDFEVVGIVDDVLKRGVAEAVSPEVYSLDRQMSARTFNPNGGSFVIRIDGDFLALIEPLRKLMREQDANLSIESVMTMEDRIRTSLARPRLYAVLLGGFAISALVIAAVGLFGVLSYIVSQRTREIAVRTALGARRVDVIRLVLRQGLLVTVSGLTAGIVISNAFIRYLTSLLYGVTAYDWMSFVGAPLLIAVIAIIACLVPGLRASRISPLTALRIT